MCDKRQIKESWQTIYHLPRAYRSLSWWYTRRDNFCETGGMQNFKENQHEFLLSV